MDTPTTFGGAYRQRIVDGELDELMAQLPAIVLDGPKGVGKTTTALQRSTSVRRLSRASERSIVEADPFVIVLDDPAVLLDEWQLVPGIWDAVRDIVDEDLSPGHFILTGSAPMRNTHSGAARMTNVRVRPLTLPERGISKPTISLAALISGQGAKLSGRSAVTLENYVDEIIAGGFPGIRHLAGRAHSAQLNSYLERIVDRDLPEAGFTVRQPAAVRAWMTAYAAATATTTSWEKIRDAATAGYESKPAKETSANYTELLTSLRILDPIAAWIPSFNHLRRIGSAPKHHLTDPALAVRLLKRTKEHLLTGNDGPINIARDGTLLGALFESLVAMSLRVFAQACGAEVFHLREHGGTHEVDFIIENGDGIIGVEVKLASSVDDRDARHLTWLKEQVGDRLLDKIIITTGPEAFRRADGTAVVPLALLGP
jgi:predicted AAA+ superfamily ATPase